MSSYFIFRPTGRVISCTLVYSRVLSGTLAPAGRTRPTGRGGSRGPSRAARACRGGVVAVPWRCRGGAVAVPWRCRGGVIDVSWRCHEHAPSRRCLVAWEWRASLQPRPPRPARPRLGRPFPDTIPGRTTRAWRPRQSYNRGVWPLGAGSPRCQPLVRPLRRASSAGDVDNDSSLAGERGERQRRAVDLGAGEGVQACGRWHASGNLIAVRSRYCVPRSQERSSLCVAGKSEFVVCASQASETWRQRGGAGAGAGGTTTVENSLCMQVR